MTATKIEGVTLGGEPIGTSLQGYLPASYARLAELLGPPNCSGDEYKVSTEWVLTHRGRTFTLYDYKETSCYDEECPSVQAFRNRPSYDWHVGADGKEGVDEFVKAVEAAL